MATGNPNTCSTKRKKYKKGAYWARKEKRPTKVVDMILNTMLTYKEIAKILNVSEVTIKNDVKELKKNKKLKAKTESKIEQRLEKVVDCLTEIKTQIAFWAGGDPQSSQQD